MVIDADNLIPRKVLSSGTEQYRQYLFDKIGRALFNVCVDASVGEKKQMKPKDMTVFKVGKFLRERIYGENL